MIDGKPGLTECVNAIHPNGEYLLKDLPKILIAGFTVTDNPQNFSISNPDPLHSALFGPLNDAGVMLRVHEGSHGEFVKGLDLIVAIARVVQVGPPTWSRRPHELSDWWKAQIAGCEPFMVPEPAPKTREEMERFLDSDPACQRVLPMFLEAVSAGSGLVSDADLREFIERATAGPDAAIEFYTRRRDGRLGVSHRPAQPPRPSRRKTAVEVPA